MYMHMCTTPIHAHAHVHVYHTYTCTWTQCTCTWTGYPPRVPKILFVGIVDGGSIKVNWTMSSDPLRPVSNYILEIRTSPEGRADDDDDDDGGNDVDEGVVVKRQNISGATNKHIIGNPDLKLAYSFRIEAMNEAGSSGYSDEHKLDTKDVGGTTTGEQQATGLAGWEIALIVIFLLLLLLLCCILILCIFLCWKREKRTYYAAKRGMIRIPR